MADTVVVSEDATATSTTALVDQITVAKTFAMLVLGLGSFVLGVVPIKLTKWWRKDPADPMAGRAVAGHSHGGDSATGSPVVSLLLCFGGGVLLFTTLLHLQPEVREGVSRLQQAGHLPNDQGTEHLGDLIFCAGFFMVFIIDEIVHSVLDRFAADHADRGSAEEVLHRSMSLRRRTMSIPRASLAGSPSSIPSSADTGVGTSTASIRELLKESKGKRYRTSAWDAPPPPGAAPEDPRHHRHLHYHDNHQQTHKRPLPSAEDAEKQTAKLDHVDQSDDRGVAGQSFRGLFAVLALSFHEVFEGLAIGLEERVDNMWYLFIAVATHKLVIAFCIGLELAWSKTRRIVLVMYVATFAVVTPVGIVIGMVLVHCGSGGSVDGSPGRVAVILQGLAAGTLLYVVFFEVLARHKQSGFLHLLSIMLGFCSLLILQTMTHHHSHAPVNNDHHHHHLDHDHVHDHSSHDHVHDH
ncbi:uncharacterized protein LOC112682830 [Sipha flava]|uniref:Uncharacterized protein LOC112682830 n=1 Tax=Sipha flava TaxID=143950 RepID=A0A8B8FEQ7_9HEMI|nr:uncharacterized protein LOC112682830 [Sipha flava]